MGPAAPAPLLDPENFQHWKSGNNCDYLRSSDTEDDSSSQQSTQHTDLRSCDTEDDSSRQQYTPYLVANPSAPKYQEILEWMGPAIPVPLIDAEKAHHQKSRNNCECKQSSKFAKKLDAASMADFERTRDDSERMQHLGMFKFGSLSTNGLRKSWKRNRTEIVSETSSGGRKQCGRVSPIRASSPRKKRCIVTLKVTSPEKKQRLDDPAVLGALAARLIHRYTS